MAINCQEKERIFTINTNRTSYQMKIDRYGFLLHLYYGAKVEGSMEYLLTYADRGFSGNPYDAGADRTYSMDALPQEYPVQGTGDYRTPCLVVENTDGSYSCDLRYKSYEISRGKYGLPGLPAMYAGEDEAVRRPGFRPDGYIVIWCISTAGHHYPRGEGGTSRQCGSDIKESAERLSGFPSW